MTDEVKIDEKKIEQWPGTAVEDAKPSTFVNEEDSTETDSASEAELVEVTVHKLYLRSKPVRESKPLEVLKRGQLLTAIGFEGNYLKVETEDGATGYVDKQYVKAV